MRHSPSFRAALPATAGWADEASRTLADDLTQRMTLLDTGRDAVATVSAAFRDTFILGIEAALQATAFEAIRNPKITLETRVATASGSFFHFESRANAILLLFPGGKYVGTAADHAAFRHIAERESFLIGELPDTPRERKLQIVSELINQGSLVILPI